MARPLRLALILIVATALGAHTAGAARAQNSHPPLVSTKQDLWAAPPAPARCDSWQVRSPVLTGVLSTLTLSLWPASFGDDCRPVAAIAEKGWTSATFDLIKPHAENAFFNARRIIYLIEILLLWRIIRPVRALRTLRRSKT